MTLAVWLCENGRPCTESGVAVIISSFSPSPGRGPQVSAADLRSTPGMRPQVSALALVAPVETRGRAGARWGWRRREGRGGGGEREEAGEERGRGGEREERGRGEGREELPGTLPAARRARSRRHRASVLGCCPGGTRRRRLL